MKPKVIITIGMRSYLLPDDTGATTVVKALSRALPIYDHSYKGEIEVKDEIMEVSMSYVTKPIKLVDHNGAPIRPAAPRSRPVKGLPPITALRLE